MKLKSSLLKACLLTLTIVLGQFFTISESKAQSCVNGFTYSIVDTSDCGLYTYQFAASASEEIDSVLWSFDDGAHSNIPNATHTFTTGPGIYNVELTTIDTNGCEAFSSIPVSVGIYNPLNATISFDYNSNCSCVDIIPSAFGGTPPYNFNWFDSTNTPIQFTPTLANVCSQNNVPYLFSVTDNYGCTFEEVVYANTHHTTYDTIYMCSEVLTLEAPDGAEYYHWSNGVAGQVTTVTDTGNYHVICVYPGCTDTITHYYRVAPCDTCTNTVDYTIETSPSCIVTIHLSGTSPTPIEGWYWDFGDNNFSIDLNPQHLYDQPGTYLVSLTTTDTNNCTATTSFPLEVYGEFNIDISANTTIGCEECVELSAQGFPSPIVAYEWVGLNFGPESILNPEICHADNELITLTGIDEHGCIATDTLTVSSYNSIDDTIYICPGLDSVMLDLGPGAVTYAWTDGTNQQTTIPAISGPFWEQGNFPQCGVITSTITIMNICPDSVWPGDANFDGIANNLDLLPIGIAYQTLGPARLLPSINWIGQASDHWPDTLSNGVNYKHVDCNGDGNINADDTLAIILNYGFTHNKSPNPNNASISDPLLFMEFSPDTPGVNELVTITVHLGTENQQANDVYGLAFTLNLDPSLIDTNSIQVNFTNSWMGTLNQNLLALSHFDSGNGRLDMALTRTDHSNISGYGPIATVNVITIDNLSGKQETLYEELEITFSDILLINNQEIEIPINSENSSVTISDDTDGINELGSIPHLSIYPNPAKGELFVKSDKPIQQVILRDALGKITKTQDFNMSSISLDISNLPNGIYTIEVITANNLHQQSLIVIDK